MFKAGLFYVLKFIDNDFEFLFLRLNMAFFLPWFYSRWLGQSSFWGGFCHPYFSFVSVGKQCWFGHMLLSAKAVPIKPRAAVLSRWWKLKMRLQHMIVILLIQSLVVMTPSLTIPLCNSMAGGGVVADTKTKTQNGRQRWLRGQKTNDTVLWKREYNLRVSPRLSPLIGTNCHLSTSWADLPPDPRS